MIAVNAATDRKSMEKIMQMIDTYDNLYGMIGIYPEYVENYTDGDLKEMKELSSHPKIVAIGEIGLDYHWAENPPREEQQRVLRRQLELALELDLPVIVHDRDAHADCLAVVSDYPALRGVFHCYSGSAEPARELLRRGWYLGFDGPITYKNAKKALEVLAETPADRILLETDSPYLPPVPHRGERNDSRNLVYIAAAAAAVRGVSPEELAETAAENGRRLFGIK